MTHKIKKEKLMKTLQWVILPLVLGLLIAGCSTEPKPEHYGLYAVVAGGKLVELKKTDELPSEIGTTDPILHFILYSDELKHGDFRLYQYNIKERVEFKVIPVKGEMYMHKLVPTIELQRGYYLMRREEDARDEGWDLMYEPAGQRELKLALVEFYMMMPERTRRYKSERINALVAEAVRGTNNREILNKAASFIKLNPYKTIQLTQTDRGRNVYPHSQTDRGRNVYPRFSPDGSQLVFVSGRDGNYEIYLVNADGTNLTRLTNNKAADFSPAFSPDGKQIVFVSTRRDRYVAIYTMNIDGSNQTRLTKHQRNDNSPAFSPDGKRILFRAGRYRYDETYLVNADGTNLTQLKGSSFRFSPDGKRLAFVSKQDGNREIYLINVDGGKKSRLTNNKAEDSDPVFSPDGSQILFVSERDGNAEIYLMNADASNKKRLTNNEGYNGYPAFSPDGKQILFVSNRNDNDGIYTMNVDGSNQTRLTNNVYYPTFSPDGKRILFASERYDRIYLMNADGNDQTRLYGESFQFSPDGKRLAFVSERDGNEEIYLMELDIPISSNDILAFVEKKE